MANLSDLIETFAGALGLPRRLVEETAHHLREAKMLSADESEQATIEHAGILLLGLMAAKAPKDAPNSVQIFDQLPLDRVNIGGFMLDGRYEGGRVADDDPFLEDLGDMGATFGEFLVSLLWAHTKPTDTMPVPARITVGGGPGTTYATVDFLFSAGGIDRGCMVRFSLAPLGGDWLPDDAPKARLDTSTTAPGAIFAVLQKLFSDTDCPREAALAHARANGLQRN